MVATSVEKKGGRDIIKLLRHHLAVATSSTKERGSRHHSVVATSTTKREGNDVVKWSRHQLQGKEVATSFSCRDINCEDLRLRHHLAVVTSSAKERRSRHHSVVATSATKREGRDVVKRSRHQLQGKEVATSFSCRDI